MVIDEIKGKLIDTGEQYLSLNDRDQRVVYKIARDHWKRSLNFSFSKLFCPKMAVMTAVSKSERIPGTQRIPREFPENSGDREFRREFPQRIPGTPYLI